MGRGEGVQSVHRALDVLEAVTLSGELSVTHIAQAVGLSPSTAHGLIRTLTMRGYLMRTANGYRLGASTAGLSGVSDMGSNLSLYLDPLLEELSHATNAASVAAVLIGREARIIAAQPSPGKIATHLDIGAWKDPFELATGRVLVALGPQARWADFIARTTQSPRPSSSWQHELLRIRKSHLSLKSSRDPRGAAGMGMPVFGRNQDVICAVGCYVPSYFASELFTQSRLESLWGICRQASERFGGTLPEPKVDFAAFNQQTSNAVPLPTSIS